MPDVAKNIASEILHRKKLLLRERKGADISKSVVRYLER
jgi:hypothetical protein